MQFGQSTEARHTKQMPSFQGFFRHTSGAREGATVADLVYMGRSDDNNSLIFLDDDGNEFTVAIDDHLVRDVSTPRQVEVASSLSTSALSPREIQIRVRRGESIEAIAADAGESVTKVERFAGPVLAERHHMATKARETFVRRPHGDVILQDIALPQLVSRGIDTLEAQWDSYRREDGRWNVTLTWPSGSGSGTAMWIFDPMSQTIIAGDDEARWIFDEASAAQASEDQTETRPRLVGLPAPTAEYDDVVDENPTPVHDLEAPSWAGPGQPTMPVPVIAPVANDNEPSWDDILFGTRPTDN